MPDMLKQALAQAEKPKAGLADGLWRTGFVRLKRWPWLTGGLIALMIVILWTMATATAPIFRSSTTIEIDSSALSAMLAEAVPEFVHEPLTADEVVAWLDETIGPALAMRKGDDAISVIGVDHRVIVTGQSQDPEQAAARANDSAKRALAFLDDRKATLRQGFVSFAGERKKAIEEAAPRAATASYDVTAGDADEPRLLEHFVQALDEVRGDLQQRMSVVSDRSVDENSSEAAASREQELAALRKHYLAVIIDLGKLRDMQRVERPGALQISTQPRMLQMSALKGLATALESETWITPWARITKAAPVPAVPLLRRLPVLLPAVLALGLLLGLFSALLVTLLIDDEDDDTLRESEEIFEHPRWPII